MEIPSPKVWIGLSIFLVGFTVCTWYADPSILPKQEFLGPQVEARQLVHRDDLELGNSVFGDHQVVLHQIDVECRSSDKLVAWKSTFLECAEAVHALGGQFFIYGKRHKTGRCYVENTVTSSCNEGWQRDAFDFYAVEEKIVRNVTTRKHSDVACAFAQFLTKATFGPTRKSMRDIQAQGTEKWLQNQLGLPATLHRQHFRKLTNPKIDGHVLSSYLQYEACDVDSRWSNRTFQKADVGKLLDRHGDHLRVDDVWRTDVDKVGTSCIGSKCLSWDAIVSNYDKWYICSVDGVWGGLVSISKNKRCWTRSRQWMNNPPVLTHRAIPVVDGPFTVAGGGWIVMSADAARRCKAADVVNLIRSGNEVFRLDTRLKLLENTVQNPDVSEAAPCVPMTFLNEQTCLVKPPGSTCKLACGSPGEVGNEPSLGHQYAIANGDTLRTVDYTFDRQERARHLQPKESIWGQHALFAEDQLRQRVAWALSQILVVGQVVNSGTVMTELYTNHYDIFVRNAFSNYKDVLRQFTFSPLTAHWLTYYGSNSFDYSKTYPDENYAREIMQLFTLGVWKLHPNGSKVEIDGSNVPTYSNRNIMDFARVFTGFYEQDSRTNLEQPRRWNEIDPMAIWTPSHDIHPKPKLDGGFLGDGYPLCDDLPSDNFLRGGAKYEFLGHYYNADFLEISNQSLLFKSLCDDKDQPSSSLLSQPATHLQPVLIKSGMECRSSDSYLGRKSSFMDCAEAVRARGDHFFIFGKDGKDGRCYSENTASSDCIEGWEQDSYDFFEFQEAVFASSSCSFRGVVTLKDTVACTGMAECAARSPSVVKVDNVFYRHVLPPCVHYFFDLRTTCQCEEDSSCKPWGKSTWCYVQPGCKYARGRNRPWAINPHVCQETTEVYISAEGMVAGHTKNFEPSKFMVEWQSRGFPTRGVHDAKVHVEPAFLKVPSTGEELRTRAVVGAFRPRISCTYNCLGEVKAYAPNGALDTDTVFEFNLAYFKNIHAEVQIGEHMFRNPPVFSHPDIKRTRQEMRDAVLAEINSLFDHLVEHDSTPVFVSKKLIQKLVTSNPSPKYLEDVAGAFRTGRYNGTDYSLKWGCLAATTAAIFLHPAASAQSATNGLLREPMVKMMHFLRSMEYAPAFGDQISFQQHLHNTIGQFPYNSPTVFNFFDAMYSPTGFGQPEPEPEPEPESDLSAPEFQIFTPSWFLEFMNGMGKMIHEGRAFGLSGELMFEADADMAMADLDLLLAGGRLNDVSAAVVQREFDNVAVAPKLRLRAAQQAMMFTPEFNNLGSSNVKSIDKSIRVEDKDDVTKESYKAVVLVFLKGGADTYNMIVPHESCSLANDYKSRRGAASLNPKTLHKISTKGQLCEHFGLHPSLTFLAELYNEGQMAVMSDVGNLVEPTTSSSLKRVRRCPAHYAHGDAQNAAQTLFCQRPSGPMGYGGRIADALSKRGLVTKSFSIRGIPKWPAGKQIAPDLVDHFHGAVQLRDLGDWEEGIWNLTAPSFDNIYFNEFGKEFRNAITTSEMLSAVLSESELMTQFPPSQRRANLVDQFRQVARLISARKERKVNRDFFYVELGGWDHHSNLHKGLATQFGEVDSALKFFVTELKAQGVFDSVVTFSMSDFGRTLVYNGAGSDHGWSGNHFVLGGSVNGGRVFNKFIESYAADTEFDAGRGRVIPQYPWESMVAPIAEWLGINSRDGLEEIFPNLKNFNSSAINTVGDVFK